ncbi:MAG: beta strand repeat-containing protein [Desulfuromonadaceae bacterium]
MATNSKQALMLCRQIVVTAVIACALAAEQAQANGSNPTVINGQASFSTLGGSLNITNTPGTIINWQGFSIGADETTRFIQQSAASSVLNRVIGSDPSLILGTLVSNGRVFLINPNGILFGHGSRIDVAGLAASTLNLSNQDFLAGQLNFTPDLLSGNVENRGSITTPSGGTVHLVGSNVINSGIINSPQGDVILAAGQSVKIFDTSTPGVRVELTANDNSAVNLGEILAQSGQIGIYGAALRNSGIINADQVVRDGSGSITLRAKQDVLLEAGSHLSANGDQAGVVTVQSETGTTLVSGTIEAKSSDTQQNGGTVQLLGDRVGLVTATVDASGSAGGGTVLVGGDYQGKSPSVQNATATYVSPDSTINADAITTGDGGKVIVWADDITRFHGSISARGGGQSGDGGFSEVSGKKMLVFDGSVDLRASGGVSGTLLLDPNNITIQDAGPDVNGDAIAGDDLNAAVHSPDILFGDYVGNNSIITTSQVVTQLNSANVTLEATNDITVAAAINASGNIVGKTLTLQAGHDVIVNAALTTSSVGGGALILSAGNNVTVGAALTATSGSVVLRADNDGTGPGLAGGTVTFGAVTAETLSIRFNPASYATTSAEIAAYAPKATLTGTLTGTFDARAWTFIDNSSATAQNKSYDGATAATLTTPFTFKSGPDGTTAGQIVNLSTGAANFNSKDVTTATTVNFTGYGLGGADADLYSLFSQPASQSAHITPTALTATVAAADKVYNGNTTAAPTLSITSGLVSGETVIATGSATFNSKDVVTANLVTVTSTTLADGSGLASNYSLAAGETVTAHITPAALTATVAAADKVYDGNTTAAPTLSITGGLVSGEVVTATGSATFNSKDVVTANLVTVNSTALADGSGLASNYSLVAGETVTAHITPAALTATVAAPDKIYNGDTTAAPTLSITAGLVSGETVIATGSATFNSKDVVTANLVTVNSTALANGTNGLASNYSLAAGETVTAYITPVNLNITGLTASDKVYDANTAATLGGIAAITVLGADNVTVGGVASGTFDTKDAGNDKSITVSGNSISGTDAENYNLIQQTGLTADITPAPLHIAANGTTRLYGSSNLVNSATYIGFMGGENATALTGTLAFATPAIPASNVGSYAIIPSGQSSNNYTIDYINGSLQVTPVSLMVSANIKSKVYGTNDPALTFSTIGLINNPSLGVIDTAGSVFSGTLARTPGETVSGGPYAISQGSLAANSNYTLVGFTGSNLTITPAALMVAANPQSKVFGQNDPALTYTVAGLKNNPALGITDSAAAVLSGTLTRAPGESALGGPYRISRGSISATSNYTLGFTGNNLTITGAAAEPVLGFNAEQVIFAGVINNEFYYRPGNFWHIALNPNNADPGFDVMRGTNNSKSRLSERLNRCDSVFGGGMCETWSFPQQFEKDKKKK